MIVWFWRENVILLFYQVKRAFPVLKRKCNYNLSGKHDFRFWGKVRFFVFGEKCDFPIKSII